MCPNTMIVVLIRREATDSDRKGTPSHYRGKDWRYASTSQGTPEATMSWKKQERIFLKRLWREHGPINTLV